MRAPMSIFILGCFVNAHNAFAQQLVAPIRPLGSPVAASRTTFSRDVDVRETSRGVLIYDRVARRLVLLDSALAVAQVLADTTEATQRRHGRFIGRLMWFTGDSSLFVDPAAEAIHVLDESGRFVRTMAAPMGSHVGALVSGVRPGFDGSHVVYLIGISASGGSSAGASASAPTGNRATRDSALVVRVGLGNGLVDTVTTVYRPSPHTQVNFRSSPPSIRVGPMNPLDRVDQWTTLADGSVAVLRGDDYHLDLFRPDASVIAQPKIPFEWQRLSDAAKEAYIDSVKFAQETRRAAEKAMPDSIGPEDEMANVARRSREATDALDVPGVEYHFVAARELPDYRRAFSPSGVIADRRNNVWAEVLLAGRTDRKVYDVIDSGGKRVDRVELPPGRTIVGFGANAIYATAGERGSARIERFEP